MAHKELKFNEDARRALERGVNILADALSLPGATFSAPPTESKPSQSTVGGSRTATPAPRMTD